MTIRRALARIAAAAALAVATAAPVNADAVSRAYQVRDDDAARFAITQFRTFSGRGEWRAAVQELQKLFDLPSQRGVVVRVEASNPPRYESAWRTALRLYDSLPDEGRRAWEDLQRRQAEELLARGIRLRRDEDLAAAARRFPARDVRRRAHDALAHLATARGDFDRAARELELLLECTEPAAAAEVRARILFSRAQMGDAEGAARAALLARGDAATIVATPGGPSPLGAFAERMRALAAASAGAASAARQFGGDRHGSGVSEPPPETAAPGWREPAPTGVQPGQENEDYRVGADTSRRTVIPLIAQGAVFLNNGLSLVARDVATGRETWRYSSPQRAPAWRDHPNAYSACAYADGVVIAPLATRADAPDIEERSFYGRTIIYALPHRVLHAFDARTGAVLWAHDTARLSGRADAEEIERESVASAPLVVGDDVIVLTWFFNTRYESRLVCFDRATGATRWRTSLVHAQQETNLFGRPVKELVAPPPAELDGVVYASTGLGIAAAVDRVSGGIVWLAEHATLPIPTTSQWYQTNDRRVRWRPSPVAATRTAIVMAPLESAALFAFDPRSGARLWHRDAESPGAWSTWFLGTYGSRAFTLGSRVFAIDLATGRDAWPNAEAGRLAKSGSSAPAAVGRGLLTPEGVWAPTARGIVQVGLEDGALVASRDTPRPAKEPRPRPRTDGDFVAADGALVVAQSAAIDCYYRFEDLRSRLAARLAAAPDDPQLRLEAGEILRAAGLESEAIVNFEHALAVVERLGVRGAERTETTLRRSLVDALLARSQSRRVIADGPGAWADLQRAVAVARDRGDAVRALFALAACAEATDRGAACDAALARIAAEFGDVQTSVDDEQRADAGTLAAFRLAARAAERGELEKAVDGWLRLLEERPDTSLGANSVSGAVREALRALGEKHGAKVEALVTARCRKTLDAAAAARDTTALSFLARTSPSASVQSDAALAAASIFLESRRPREGAAMLEGLLLRPQPPAMLARALWGLHEAYRALEETPRERAALRRLAEEAPDAALADGRRAADAVREELQAPRFRDAPPALPDPRPPLALRWESLEGTDQPPIVPVQVEGTQPRALARRLLLEQDRVLRCVAADDRKESWKVPLGIVRRRAFGTPSLVVLVGEDARTRPSVVRLDGIRAEDGATPWTRKLPGQYVQSESALGLVYVLRRDTDLQGDTASWLTAVSADTGDVVADRRLGPDIHPYVTCAADAVVVYEKGPAGRAARRRVVTLDGATLTVRGSVEIDGHMQGVTLSPPGSALVVTTVRGDGVACVDVTTGGFAWPAVTIAGAGVKRVLAVPGGLFVFDDADRVRRIDAATGAVTWTRALGEEGRTTGFLGEAAEGDLVVATLVTSSAADPRDAAVAVGLDAATGEVRWRTPLPLEGRTLPHPRILQSVVAYELNVRKSADPKSGFASSVVFLERAGGNVSGTIAHPALGKLAQSVFHIGPYTMLWSALGADVAVYSGAASPR